MRGLGRAKNRTGALLVLALWLALGMAMPVSAQGSVEWQGSLGPYGGQVTVIATHPQDENLILAGTPNGLYKTVNQGQVWAAVGRETLPYQAIRAILFASFDERTVFLGGDRGLFVSDDLGDTWLQVGGGLPDSPVQCLAVDSQTGLLYLGVQQEVWRGKDGGKQWARIGEIPAREIIALVFDPAQPGVIYAGTDNGVWISTNGGTEWALYGDRSLDAEQVRGIAFTREQLTPALLIAGTSGVLRSLGEREPAQIKAKGPALFVVTDPLRPDDVYAYTAGDGLVRLTEGGQRFEKLDAPGANGPFHALAVAPQSGMLFLGASHGFYVSQDRGATWQPRHQGLDNTSVRALLDLPGDRDRLVAATLQGFFVTGDRGATWYEPAETLRGIDMTALALDAADLSVVYAGTGNGRIYRIKDQAGQWSVREGPKPESEQQVTALVAARVPDMREPSTLFAARGDLIWYSRDQGEGWQSLGFGLASTDVGALWVSPGDEPSLYAGVGSYLYRLPLNAASLRSPDWQTINPAALRGRITGVTTDPARPSVLYVSTNAGSVYRSLDEGKSWTNLTSSALPSQALVHGVLVVPFKGRPSALIALTGTSLYGSEDNGDTWQNWSTGRLSDQAVVCGALEDKASGRVYLGTLRGGVYSGRLRRRGLTPYVIGVAAVLGAAVLAGLGAWSGRRFWPNQRRQQLTLLEEQWERWSVSIGEALLVRREATQADLAGIPSSLRQVAMRRYLDAHRDQDLVLQDNPPCIRPGRAQEMDKFALGWQDLVQNLDAPRSGLPVATRLIEQLCELLSFAPVEHRNLHALIGYMIKAPTMRLSVPGRFPIMFLLKREIQGEDVRDARDLLRALGATSFFALLIAVDDDPSRHEKARQLRQLTRGGAEDFIVLNYADLLSLFLATDPTRALTDLILRQTDLAIVSPYVTNGPVPENMFFGRDYELKAIMRTIRDRSYAIVGGRKIGKTSVLTKVNRLMEQTSGYAAVYLDCQHVANYDEFFDALAVKSDAQVSAATPDALRRAIVRLRHHNPNATVVLLLDEVDNVLIYDNEHQSRLFRVFRALSQEGLCRFVFCGERTLNRALHDPNAPLFNFCNILRLSYLLPQDARRIIVEPMSALGLAFEDAELLPQRIIEISSCHPNIVQALCQMLIVRVNERGERVITMQDLEDVRLSNEFRDLYLEVTWGNANTLDRLLTVLMGDRQAFDANDVHQALTEQRSTIPMADVETSLDVLVLLSILRKEDNHYVFAATSLPRLMIEANLIEGFREGLAATLRAERGMA